MSPLYRSLLLCTAMTFSLHGHADAPAGTPDHERGSASSPSGNPAPQEDVETRRDEDGNVRTLDGRPVNTRDGNMTNDGKRDDSPEHSSPGGLDGSSDPGVIE